MIRKLKNIVSKKSVLWYAFIFSALLVAGCDPATKAGIDQCLRNKIFLECMASLPVGPQKTEYNDWDEVVSECADTAYYQSYRPKNQIKDECKVGN